MTTNTLPLRLSVVGAVLALIAAGHALAQEASPRDIYGADQRERTPAITAFPEYPEDARRDRLEGETNVCFRVNAEGEVVRPDVRSSTHKIFERPAMKAIRASTFEPLATDEIESRSEVCRVYRFKLNPTSAADDSLEPQVSASGSSANIAASSSQASPLPPAGQSGLASLGAAAAAPSQAGTASAEVSAIPLEDPNNAPVCRTMKRPGSLIRDTICYSREEQLARQVASKQTVNDLEREQQWRDQKIFEAAAAGRYPTGTGIGPN